MVARDAATSGADSDRPTSDPGGLPGETVRETAAWGLRTGLFPVAVGVILVARGLGRLRRGKRLRGLLSLVGGLGLLALGRSRWRAQDTGAALGAASSEDRAASAGDADSAGENAVAEEIPEPEPIPTVGGEPEPLGPDVEILGAAAFDGHSLEVPVPQATFDRELLSPGEVFWGRRLADGAVVLSDRFDPIWDDEDFHYVGSSEVDAETRVLRIPDAVRDTWDETYGGGDALVGGDDLTFCTTPELAALDQIRVVPAVWREQVLGDSTE